MSHCSERAATISVTRAVRAYFAPLHPQLRSPVVFDPAAHAAFDLDAPPAPWIDLGPVEHFDRTSVEENVALCSGSPSIAALASRRSRSARVEFDFCSWGKPQMAIACGSQHINVLASDPNADSQPLGGTPLPGVAILPGSTATEIILGPGPVAAFQTGDLVAVDLDYQQQTGYVGSGISGAYIRDPSDVKHDPDYIRRITFNVGRIALKTANSLVLAQPLLGGTPPAGASVQKVVAFTDREGGSFFQEWSALFVFQEDAGGRICLYYPRLLASPPPASSSDFRRESRLEIAKPIASLALHAAFVALPLTDDLDGESILCYRTYLPCSQAALY